jgi:transposase-like protein
MAQGQTTDSSYEIVCPHCSKPFAAELMTGDSDRHAGFKCPHCRLFVAYERAGLEAEGEEAP